MIHYLGLPVLLLRSAWLLLSDASLRTYVISPFLYGALSFFLSFFFLSGPLDSTANVLMSSLPSWLQFAFLQTLLHYCFLGIAATLLASVVFFLVLTLRLEHFIYTALERCSLPVPEQHRSLIESIFFGLKEDAKQLVIFSFLGLLIAIAAFFPLLAPLNLLASAYILGIKTLDVPCSVLLMPFAERWALARKHSIFLTLLGFLHLLLLAIPLVGICTGPVFYIAVLRYFSKAPQRDSWITAFQDISLKNSNLQDSSPQDHRPEL